MDGRPLEILEYTRLEIWRKIGLYGLENDVFAQRYTLVVVHATSGLDWTPEIVPPPANLHTPSSTWFLGPTKAYESKRHLDRFSRFSTARGCAQ